MRQVDLSTTFLFEDLKLTVFLDKRLFRLGNCRWGIAWYPTGIKDASDGYCSLFLHYDGNRVCKTSVSFELTKDGVTISQKHFSHEYGKTSNSRGYKNFAKSDTFLGSKIVLKLKLDFHRLYQVQKSSNKRFREILRGLHKDISMVCGNTLIKVNSDVLKNASNVFLFMLDEDHGFLESKEKNN